MHTCSDTLPAYTVPCGGIHLHKPSIYVESQNIRGIETRISLNSIRSLPDLIGYKWYIVHNVIRTEIPAPKIEEPEELKKNDFERLLDKAASADHKRFVNTVKAISELFPPEKGPHDLRDLFKHLNVPFHE